MSRKIELPLGKRLGALAKTRGLKQIDLASAIGLSNSQVNRFFQGNSEIKAEKLLLLLRELGLSIDASIDREIAKANGLDISSEGFGEVVQRLAESMKASKKTSFVDFISAFALHNASPHLKEDALKLKELI